MTSGQSTSGSLRPDSSAPRGARQITRKQRQVLTAIQRFSTLYGYMPSVRELGKELGGLAPATVQHHLTALRGKGFLEHDGAAHGLRMARSVLPVTLGRAGAATARVPSLPPRDVTDGLQGGQDGRGGGGGGAVADGPTWGLELPGMQVVVPLLGTISAGRPLEAVEESEEFVPIPASLAKGSTFALRVRGRSMVEDAILDGDVIVVQACERVADGEAAVVLLPDDTATLKRVYVEKDCVRLQPANSSMAPIRADRVRIRGKVVGLIRRF
jgi:repressor LexA